MDDTVKSKLWNIIFSILFVTLFIYSLSFINPNTIIEELEIFEFILLSLASFRLIRLVVYDKVMKWFRELFQIKEPTGICQTITDLLGCPWCFGVWGTFIILVLYFIIPYGNVFVLLLAIAGVGSFLQILINLIGWNAEYKKIETQKLKK